MKTALTIAGSDCSGGAGVQADLKTMSALGVFGMSVIVSVVAENTARVLSIEDISPKVIADQIDAVFEDIPPDAVKVGMLSTPACMEAVAAGLKKYRPRHVVIDPVMYAKNGCPLMDPGSIARLIEASTGRTPLFLGKPSQETLRFLLERTGCREEELAVVGDRLYTDIALAQGTKALSILVMTGETTPEMLRESAIQPSLTAASLEEIAACL